MASRRSRDPSKSLKAPSIFYRSLPGSMPLFALLVVVSVVIGIAAVTLMHFGSASSMIPYLVTAGAVTGILTILIPSTLTVIAVRAANRKLKTKYVILVVLIAAVSYATFMLIGGVVYVFAGLKSIASALILVGDAGIFGWWFFANKILMGRNRKGILLALVQPTLNLLAYIPASRFLFSIGASTNLLLAKLYAAIAVFLLMGYVIIYFVDAPVKRSVGFGGIGAFSHLVQNWLYDINISAPFGGEKFGMPADIETSTIVFKSAKTGAKKAIIFVPNLHYGPFGSIGGSEFPYLLSRHIYRKYKVPGIVMHGAVNMDRNPISSSQLGTLIKHLDASVQAAMSSKPLAGVSYSEGSSNGATVKCIDMDGVRFATLTRAPRITEDIDLSASMLFKGLLEGSGSRDAIVIDAHNSRYESAPKKELDGISVNSIYANHYAEAIRQMNNAYHRPGGVLRLGVSSPDIYDALGRPEDMAAGNMDVMVFRINGKDHAIIQFNANNMLPSLRAAIVESVKRDHNIEAEVYTTDTHAVNSLNLNVSNVLGRKTRYEELSHMVEVAIVDALSNMEEVKVHYHKAVLGRFMVWGTDITSKLHSIAGYVVSTARLVVPASIIAGFIIAIWVISLI